MNLKYIFIYLYILYTHVKQMYELQKGKREMDGLKTFLLQHNSVIDLLFSIPHMHNTLICKSYSQYVGMGSKAADELV